MAAIKLRWPTALVQFEDFQSKHAIKLLMRYKKEYLMFNDDIQVEFRRNIITANPRATTQASLVSILPCVLPLVN